MPRLRATVVAIVLFSASVLVASESLRDCLMNCRPGKNACSDCCLAQDDQLNGGRVSACKDKCFSANRECNKNCEKSRCKSAYDRRSGERFYPE